LLSTGEKLLTAELANRKARGENPLWGRFE